MGLFTQTHAEPPILTQTEDLFRLSQAHLNSCDVKKIRSDTYFGSAQTHELTLSLTQIHSDCFCLTQIHPDPPSLIQTSSDSLRLIQVHAGSLRVDEIHTN